MWLLEVPEGCCTYRYAYELFCLQLWFVWWLLILPYDCIVDILGHIRWDNQTLYALSWIFHCCYLFKTYLMLWWWHSCLSMLLLSLLGQVFLSKVSLSVSLTCLVSLVLVFMVLWSFDACGHCCCLFKFCCEHKIGGVPVCSCKCTSRMVGRLDSLLLELPNSTKTAMWNYYSLASNLL